jgi:tetratricopeptide (TPR) repeat protein
MSGRLGLERSVEAGENAAKAWEKARLALPFSAEVREAEGRFWEASKRDDLALASFDEGLCLEPLWAFLWMEKGDLLARQGQVKASKDCYRRALQIHEVWKGKPLDPNEAYFVVLSPERERVVRKVMP